MWATDGTRTAIIASRRKSDMNCVDNERPGSLTSIKLSGDAEKSFLLAGPCTSRIDLSGVQSNMKTYQELTQKY